MSQPIVPLVQLDEVGAPAPEPVRNWVRGHDVQFYDSENYLGTVVSTFLVEGVRAAQPLVVIATDAHCRLFRERMRAAGICPEDLVEGRDIVWLDAHETLQAFMEGDLPNAELFELTVGAVFERVMANGRGYVVTRAYGEMVDLLWRAGKIEGAIALEQLWNGLALRYSFALLCAYSMGNFVKEAHGTDFARICAAHRHVSPTEAYTTLEDGDRLAEIARLQQRARALEAEIEYRKEVEAALLDVIAHRRRMEDVIRRSERELRDVLDNAPLAIHWVDASGRITWANRQELMLLGYSSREYVGRDISEFHHDPAQARELLRRLAGGETIRDFHSTLRCKDGSLKRVLISSNVRWKDGNFGHTRCFTREIGTLSLS
jgi:PAS domain S-box-containing protein